MKISEIPPPKNNGKKIYPKVFQYALRIGIASFLIWFAIHLILPEVRQLNQSITIIQGMVSVTFGLAVLAEFLSYAGSGYMIKKLVAITGQHITLLNGIVITIAAAFTGIFAGGVVGSSTAVNRWLKARGIRRDATLLAGWLPPFFNDAMLVLVGFFGIAHLFTTHELTTLEVIGFGLMLVTLGGVMVFVLWGIFNQQKFTSLLRYVSQHWAKIRNHNYDPDRTQAIAERFFSTWDMMVTGGWKGPTIGALLNITFDVLALYFLFAAAGYSINPGVLLTGYGLPLLLSRVSFLPGGVGIVEGTMIALYNGMGVPSSVSVVVVLAYRLLSFWIPTLLGLPLMIYLERKKTPDSPIIQNYE